MPSYDALVTASPFSAKLRLLNAICKCWLVRLKTDFLALIPLQSALWGAFVQGLTFSA
jgi:hypothetical protein